MLVSPSKLVAVFMIIASAQCQEKKKCIVTPLHFGKINSTALELLLQASVHDDLYTNATKIIFINSGEHFDTIVQFVSRTFMHRVTTADICDKMLEVVGDIDYNTARIIHTLAGRANLSVTLVSAIAPSTFLPTTNLFLPNLLHITPLIHYVQALSALLDKLNWTRIGLISDNTQYYEYAAELVQQKLLENPERKIIPFLRTSDRDNASKAIQTFKDYETDVIFISTNDKLACTLLHLASKSGLTWPVYAWIIFNVTVCSLSHTCKAGNVISLRDTSILTEAHASSCNISMFLNSVFKLVFNNESKFQESKHLNNISISLGSREIALYDAELQLLEMKIVLAGMKPRGTILRKHFNDYGYVLHITLVMIMFLFLFAFVTAILVLYIYFRKEPEIKATSVSVSLSMFLGCYILLSHSPLLATDVASNTVCHLLVWLSVAGIPIPLITATVLVKMLRVYLIFYNPYSYRKRLFADPCLFLYIMVLVFPSLSILIVWSTYDPFTLAVEESLRESYVFVYNRCNSEMTIIWLGLLLVFYLILSLALLFVALKTSKIRYKHFRDTKATNAFAFLSVFILILCLIYWYFFRLQEVTVSTIYVTNGLLYTTHACIILFCQIFLFVPKIYPPLKRCVAHKRQ